MKHVNGEYREDASPIEILMHEISYFVTPSFLMKKTKRKANLNKKNIAA